MAPSKGIEPLQTEPNPTFSKLILPALYLVWLAISDFFQDLLIRSVIVVHLTISDRV